MKDFDQWLSEQDIFCGDNGINAAERAFYAAVEITAKRCKEIAQQRRLSESQAIDIGKKISEEFGV